MTNDDSSLKRPKRRKLVRLVLFALLVTVLVVALPGWLQVVTGASSFLERTPPEVTVEEFPRGVGLAPVSVKINLKDDGAGLDEIVVRTVQKSNSRELLRKTLGGAKSADITVDFQGNRSTLEEGLAALEIKAFDRSFWSNPAHRTFPLKVDFRKPKVEVLTSQHNAVEGGSQLVFYKAYDEDLAISGVKVGDETFIGYPAHGIDPAFEDHSLFVAIYAVRPNKQVQASSIRVFAEDQVGNFASTGFYNHIDHRSWRNVKVTLTEDYLREKVGALAERNLSKLQNRLTEAKTRANDQTAKGSDDRLVTNFKLINENLRQINENELINLIEGPHFERLWENSFQQLPGSIQSAYGENLDYRYNSESIGSAFKHGYEFKTYGDSPEVLAINDGIVSFSYDLGVYGRSIGIDHGLGLFSVYGYLDSATVKKGDSIAAGQKIGVAGSSGLARGNQVYFEMRVHGVAIDPREWWDQQWYYGHITAKINEIKRSYGIPVYKPLS